MTQHQSLRERLAVHYGHQQELLERLVIPATGRIDSEVVERVQRIAERAQRGETAARDQLYFALRPRLHSIGQVLRPWPDTPNATGIWDRDDVRQESWLIFVELLSKWDGSVGFIPYLLARFSWRLRDRILRGIGKPQTQYGTTRVSPEPSSSRLVADESEQPESIAIARSLLEDLIRRQMMGDSTPGELDAWIDLISSRKPSALVSPDYLLDISGVGKKADVA